MQSCGFETKRLLPSLRAASACSDVNAVAGAAVAMVEPMPGVAMAAAMPSPTSPSALRRSTQHLLAALGHGRSLPFYSGGKAIGRGLNFWCMQKYDDRFKCISGSCESAAGLARLPRFGLKVLLSRYQLIGSAGWFSRLLETMEAMITKPVRAPRRGALVLSAAGAAHAAHTWRLAGSRSRRAVRRGQGHRRLREAAVHDAAAEEADRQRPQMPAQQDLAAVDHQGGREQRRQMGTRRRALLGRPQHHACGHRLRDDQRGIHLRGSRSIPRTAWSSRTAKSPR